ncbi:osteopetrosis-associated transmembrane protein 1-like [Dreissena polymorpha]|uniref:Osteopetrosis-associated transmembrane protein 1 n=1 Tax=Dreissena polymorpha TaxID=45954 RepID=A0A9D4CY72_DREPO|nr:osteopetrosis-associated transmembrane protein 1-like [Dreissena polymorpha]KAH3735646.1 hypothetical protein DPMN_042181 [Dreissena polymorpha]
MGILYVFYILALRQTFISGLTHFGTVFDNEECPNIGRTNTQLLQSELLYSEILTVGHNIPDKCMSYVADFGDDASMFIKCSVSNARPFRFCENCYCHYVKASNVYERLVKDDFCNNQLLIADKVQIIHTINRSMDRIWQDADCDKCFAYLREDNGTVHSALTSETREFLDLYRNFTTCINETELSANQTVCDTCRPYYRKMNEKFDNLLNDRKDPEHVCMDIVDMMNYTRITWGEELNCTISHKNLGAIWAAVVVLGLTPIGFYASFAVYGAKRTRSPMRQKRLQSLAYGSLESPRAETVNEDESPGNHVSNHVTAS